MKKLVFLITLVISVTSYGQVHKVDGIQYKEMTTATMNSILSNYDDGFAIYNSDTESIWQIKSGVWEELTSGEGLDPADQTKLDNITITQGVDLDDIESKANSALQNVVEDTSPELGGNLDANFNSIENFAYIIGNIVDVSVVKSESMEVSDIPIIDNDVANKKYVDDSLGDFDLTDKVDVDTESANTIEIGVLDGVNTNNYFFQLDPNSYNYDENDVPSSTTYWGAINGTLSDQLDLQTALDGKLSLLGGNMLGDVFFDENSLENLGQVESQSFRVISGSNSTYWDIGRSILGGGSDLEFVYVTDSENDAIAYALNSSGIPTEDTDLITKGYVDANGDTGDRPSSPSTGQQYFDTTLNLPIWYNGSSWVDATGTTR